MTARVYCVMPYAAFSYLPSQLEPFGVVAVAMPFCLVIAVSWLWLAREAASVARAHLSLVIAAAPIFPWLMQVLGLVQLPAMFVEVVWLSAWTGWSFRNLAIGARANSRLLVPYQSHRTAAPLWLWCVLISCVIWWYCQLSWYHRDFMLGYNDYGHFLQRLCNTLNGRGILVESPVLPRFWDHFNPGLLLLIPSWMLCPDVHQSFAWQSLCLGMSGYLVYRIACAHRLNRVAAGLFGVAWLVHPAIGQMNLAYTYGWHPITFAIPLLLGAISALLAGRRVVALLCCTVALSMEESVFVVVSLTALTCGACQSWRAWQSTKTEKTIDPQTTEQLVDLASTLPARTWWIVGLVSAVLFVIVYQTSGLAEFQAGRFVELGSNTTEILLSPIMRPKQFWGKLLSSERWIYIALLALPCGLQGLRHGWKYLLPTLLPLAVLTVWNHQPAHSIAFQYASTLLPLFFLAAISGTAKLQVIEPKSALANGLLACVTGMVLSLYIGQLPYSGQTLLDVGGKTYGADGGPNRQSGSDDGIWLTEQIQELRMQRPQCLATGRIAAHLVGMPDIETVAQYLERRDRLLRMDARGIPIRNYEWIVLDKLESFQQTRAQVQAIEAEARAEGYLEVVDRYDIVILRRNEPRLPLP